MPSSKIRISRHDKFVVNPKAWVKFFVSSNVCVKSFLWALTSEWKVGVAPAVLQHAHCTLVTDRPFLAQAGTQQLFEESVSSDYASFHRNPSMDIIHWKTWSSAGRLNGTLWLDAISWLSLAPITTHQSPPLLKSSTLAPKPIPHSRGGSPHTSCNDSYWNMLGSTVSRSKYWVPFPIPCPIAGILARP